MVSAGDSGRADHRCFDKRARNLLLVLWLLAMIQMVVTTPHNMA